ncbi:MAG: lytic transglycosylase domain-containing protein [Syntrophales bacterium]
MLQKKVLILIILAVIINFVFPSLSLTDIYKYVDREGILHLTNVPTDVDARYVLVLKEENVRSDSGPDAKLYDHLIIKAANKYNVDSALIKAIIKTESNFNPRAISPKGAQGLMQIMPATASYMEIQDSLHPENNIEGGVRYLRYLLNLFKGDLTLALAAYNAGEGAVARHNNSIPPYQETQIYIQRVLKHFKKYSNYNGKDGR